MVDINPLYFRHKQQVARPGLPCDACRVNHEVGRASVWCGLGVVLIPFADLAEGCPHSPKEQLGYVPRGPVARHGAGGRPHGWLK